MEKFKFKKSYGQNFLNDNNILENIVKESNIKENSLVIEIGPGSGALTKYLAKEAKNVLAYEIDTRLEDILYDNLADYHNIEIIFDDFLNRNIKEDVNKYQYGNIYVVANIPYYITTPIIIKLIESKIEFDAITLMIQKEVGDRFTAKVGSHDYSSITVFLNYYFDVKKLFLVSRNSFIPKPNVDSVVISLNRKDTKYNVLNEELFFKIVRDAFQFKRKNLRNNLKKYDLDIINNVLIKYHYDLTVRAEKLSVEIFVEIANSLTKNNNIYKKESI